LSKNTAYHKLELYENQIKGLKEELNEINEETNQITQENSSIS